MIIWLYSSYNVEKEREMYNFLSVLQQLFIRYIAKREKTRIQRGKNNENNLDEVKDEVEVEMEGERGW